MRVKIKWIKAHVGHDGNELADELAKEGAEGVGNGPTIMVGSSNKVVSSLVNAKMIEKWNDRWENGKDARQTRIFFPTVNLSKSNKIRKMSKTNLCSMVRALTGNDFRRRHQSLVTGLDQGNSRLCNTEEESSDHIINCCPRLTVLRVEIFGTPQGSAIPANWHPEQLDVFFSDPTIFQMEDATREH